MVIFVFLVSLVFLSCSGDFDYIAPADRGLGSSNSEASSSSNSEVSSSGEVSSSSSVASSSSSEEESSSSVALSSNSEVSSSSSVALSSSSGFVQQCTAEMNNNKNNEYYCSDGEIKEYGKVRINNKDYKTVIIGDLEWMAEDLLDTHNWRSAQTLCNGVGDSWGLPDDQDWQSLASYPAKSLIARDCSWNGDDTFGFSAEPVLIDYKVFPASWWSFSEYQNFNAYFYYIEDGFQEVIRSSVLDKDSFLLVRCVRNAR